MERLEDCNKLAKVVKFGCDTFKDFRNLLDSFSGKKSFVIFRFGFWVMLLNQEPSFDFSTSFFFGLSFQNDRMAVDMAFELRKTNVACVSLWPGAVMTENIHDIIHCQSKNEMVKLLVIPYLRCIVQILVRIIFNNYSSSPNGL